MDINSTSSAFATLFPYSVGLNGVKQAQNMLAVYIMMGLLAIVVLLVFLFSWSRIFFNYLRHITVMGRPENQQFWAQNRTEIIPWLKRHLFYSPLGRMRQNKETQILSGLPGGSLPGRAHFILIVIYVIFNVAWVLTLPYGEEREELVAALRGRSGVMAVFNLFPTIVFALRNNPLIYILHVPYDTFQLFHRWAARIFVIEAIIHTFAWLGNTLAAGGWEAATEGFTTGSHAASFGWGAIGTSAAFMILTTSFSPIRHSIYEFFIVSHKVLVFAVFLGITLHLRIDNLPQKGWLTAIWLLWAYDYVCRIYRIIRYNFSWSRGQVRSQVTIEALDGEACRVTFHLPTHWKPSPGAHVHVWIPEIAPLQMHPFSVAWASQTELPSTHHLSEKELPLTIQDAARLELDLPRRYTTNISLVCRARSGFTRKMWDHVRALPKQQMTTWGLLEGFYSGCHEDLSSYADVLLFAGGVGITHQIMFAKQLLERYNEGTVAARRIFLVWTAPSRDCLEWIRPWMDEILQMPNRQDALRIMLFITRGSKEGDFISESGSVSLANGRCNVQAVLDDVLLERTGAMAVSVCGPGVFADSVQDAVRRRVQFGMIDYYPEVFSY
jgi:hypothetical protein